MGVIKRQGFKRSLVSFAGIFVGVVSTLFVYPMELSIYGAAQFYLSLAIILSPIATLGVQTLAIRFYPDFKNETNNNNGFLAMLMWLGVGSSIIFLLLFIIGYQWLSEPLQAIGFKKAIDENNLHIIAGLIFLYGFISLFTNYASNAKRVVVPELLRNLGFKLVLPALVLLYHFGWLATAGFNHALLAFFAVLTLVLAYYVHYLGRWDTKINWSAVTPELRKTIFSYAGFSILSVLGSVLAFRMDNVMVTSMLGTTDNGIYNIALFITNTILIPYFAIVAVAGPIIAEKWKQSDTAGIVDIYRRSSLNLLLIGGFLLSLIYLLLDDLLQLSSHLEAISSIKSTVLLLGIAKLIDMTTGLNNQIIAYSKYYRFNLYVILGLAALNLGLNYWLIPLYGIEGAAWATLVSLTLYNLAKYLFNLIVFKMQPFTTRTLYVLLLSGLAFFLTSILPTTAWPILNLFLLGSAFTLLFWLPALYFRLSPEVNDFVGNSWQKLKGYFI